MKNHISSEIEPTDTLKQIRLHSANLPVVISNCASVSVLHSILIASIILIAAPLVRASPKASSMEVTLILTQHSETTSPEMKENDSLRKATRHDALQAIYFQGEVLTGRAKRTLALQRSAELWMEVDESHQEAQKTFATLRQFTVLLQDDFQLFGKIMTANATYLRPDEDMSALKIPLQLVEETLKGRLRLNGMGLSLLPK